MTLEVAEFLRHKFLKSIRDAESELSGFVFLSDLKAIKWFVNEIKFPTVKIPRFSGTDLRFKAVSLLYELNDALAECRVFANECKEVNKMLLHFNPYKYYFILNMKKRLRAIKHKFAALVEEERFYSTLVICDQTSLMADRTFPISDQNEVVIREPKVIRSEEHVESIEGLLLGGGGNGFTAVGIVGVAGVGKTSLVHQVLNRQRVKDEFSPIIWLCLSDMIKEKHVFTYRTSIRIVTCILHKLGEMGNGNGGIANVDDDDDAIVEEEEVDISSLSFLLERLNRVLLGRRFLIVLDDVWHVNNFYSDLGSTFQDGLILSHALPKDRGGAVIVTTRIPEVAHHMVGSRNMILVEPLDRESCWRIFLETIRDNNEVLHMSTLEVLEKIKNEIKDQCYGLPLAAKELAGIIPKRIRQIESNRYMKDMYIPDELLQPDLDVEPAVHIPNLPVLVFIDMKDKQLGEELLQKFRFHLNRKQILGQDSVANWILGVICDLKLPELPSIAPMPLETSSLSGSISVVFGWKNISLGRTTLVFSLEGDVRRGKKMKTDSWHVLIRRKVTRELPRSLHLFRPVHGGNMQSEENFSLDSTTLVFSLEEDVRRAKKMKTDSWHVLIRMKVTRELPHSLHLFRPVHGENMQSEDKLTFFGGFWNCFSLEYDAPRGCGNHCFQPTQRTLSSVVCIKVMKQPGQWDILNIPSR